VTVERVTYPAASALFQSYVAAKLGDGTPVEKLVPNPRPDRFVIVGLAPSHGDSLILSHRNLIIQAWDKPQTAAEVLAEECFAILKAAKYDRSQHLIHDVVAVSTPYFFPDPDIGTIHPRYQFVASILLRGVVS
jgi:hypothetical protein